MHFVGSRDKNVIETMPNTITSSISVKYTAKNVVIFYDVYHDDFEDAFTIYYIWKNVKVISSVVSLKLCC